MNLEQHTEIVRLLTKLNERQITLFNHIKRIDNHLARQNSKVEQHESSLIIIKTYGTVALIILPVIVNIVMRMM
tara:strand:+ start:335 stop:556 length:222 start_codon:yes stop_codon:yes gene_type:complete